MKILPANCRPQNKDYSRLRKGIISKKPIRHHNRVSKSSEETSDLSWFFDPKKKKRDIVSSWFDDVSDSDVEETSNSSDSDEPLKQTEGPNNLATSFGSAYIRWKESDKQNSTDEMETGVSSFQRINYSELYEPEAAANILAASLLSENIYMQRYRAFARDNNIRNYCNSNVL
ncbi:uncharacterized protein LOC144744214 [Ciona intestinalis]